MQLTGGTLLALLLCNSSSAFPNKSVELVNASTSNLTVSQATEEQSELLSVDISNVALKDLLGFISDNFRTEFVDSEKLPQISVTVKVSDAPWQEILAAVLQAHSISYQIIDNKCYFYSNQDLNPSKLSSLRITTGQKRGFGDPGFKGDKVSVDVKGVGLDNVLRFLADNYDFDFVLNQSLQNKQVTVKVDDKPWDEVLSSILKEHNLNYNRIGKVIYIFPAS